MGGPHGTFEYSGDPAWNGDWLAAHRGGVMARSHGQALSYNNLDLPEEVSESDRTWTPTHETHNGGYMNDTRGLFAPSTSTCLVSDKTVTAGSMAYFDEASIDPRLL